MGVYLGYDTFKKAEGEIEVRVAFSSGGISIYDFGRPFIFLNSLDSLEDQVKTLIHEFIHLSDENLRYMTDYYIVKVQTDPVLKEAEERIEKQAIDVYNCQPVLVEHLRKKILEINKSK